MRQVEEVRTADVIGTGARSFGGQRPERNPSRVARWSAVEITRPATPPRRPRFAPCGRPIEVGTTHEQRGRTVHPRNSAEGDTDPINRRVRER